MQLTRLGFLRGAMEKWLICALRTTSFPWPLRPRPGLRQAVSVGWKRKTAHQCHRLRGSCCYTYRLCKQDSFIEREGNNAATVKSAHLQRDCALGLYWVLSRGIFVWRASSKSNRSAVTLFSKCFSLEHWQWEPNLWDIHSVNSRSEQVNRIIHDTV